MISKKSLLKSIDEHMNCFDPRVEVREERRGTLKIYKKTLFLLGIEIYSWEIKETV